MTTTIWLWIGAVLPCVAVSYLIYWLDKYEREPPWALACNFVAGAAAAYPALLLSSWALTLSGSPAGEASVGLWQVAYAIALPEEGLKLAVLMLAAWPWRFFNEPMDGIVYAVLIAMGFTAVENLLYLYYQGAGALPLRIFTAMPAHLLFAVLMGYYVGMAKFDPLRRGRWLTLGLGIAWLAHTLYDALIFQKQARWLPVLGVLGLYLSLALAERMVRRHLDRSPFNPHGGF